MFSNYAFIRCICDGFDIKGRNSLAAPGLLTHVELVISIVKSIALGLNGGSLNYQNMHGSRVAYYFGLKHILVTHILGDALLRVTM